MSARRKARWWTAAGASACLAAVGVVATGGAGAGPGTGAPNELEAADAPTVQSVDPHQARAIRELRRERTASDALPGRWSKTLEEAAEQGQAWGANPDLSRRTGPDVWMVPANGHICLVNPSPGDGSLGFGCASTGDVERGLLAPSDVDAAGKGVLTGVVPDGVASVELVGLDGSVRTVAVDRNTYRAAIDAGLEEVRFTDAGGGEHVLPMRWER